MTRARLVLRHIDEVDAVLKWLEASWDMRVAERQFLRAYVRELARELRWWRWFSLVAIVSLTVGALLGVWL